MVKGDSPLLADPSPPVRTCPLSADPPPPLSADILYGCPLM